jgi:hypothetical protein
MATRAVIVQIGGREASLIGRSEQRCVSKTIPNCRKGGAKDAGIACACA